jgi:D-alanyl-D-alanine carboxypeptidase
VLFTLAIAAQLGIADSIDALVKRTMAERRIPGVAIAVVQNGVTTLERAYGIANLETNAPLTTKGVFELASVTKPFTAACVMMLAREGKVKLDTSITAYIDGAPDSWRPITVRQLLDHTSGLPVDAIVGANGSALLNISTRAAFDYVSKLPLRSVPGTAWSYSDAGYFLLGMIIERASGTRYRTFMQQRVFDPLEMRESSILDRARVLPNRVSVYTTRGGDLAHWRRDWQYELPSFFGVFSTLGDLVKWDNAIRRGTLLPTDVWTEMWKPTPTSRRAEPGPQYGLGWYLGEIRGQRFAEHPGASGTFLFHLIRRAHSCFIS